MVKSHPAGMHICYALFAGISLRLCSISLRSFRITFAVYLPTHIKSLRDFFQSLLNNHRDNLISFPFFSINSQGKLVYHCQGNKGIMEKFLPFRSLIFSSASWERSESAGVLWLWCRAFRAHSSRFRDFASAKQCALARGWQCYWLECCIFLSKAADSR